MKNDHIGCQMSLASDILRQSYVCCVRIWRLDDIKTSQLDNRVARTSAREDQTMNGLDDERMNRRKDDWPDVCFLHIFALRSHDLHVHLMSS
jgi:hypothetical protein